MAKFIDLVGKFSGIKDSKRRHMTINEDNIVCVVEYDKGVLIHIRTSDYQFGVVHIEDKTYEEVRGMLY